MATLLNRAQAVIEGLNNGTPTVAQLQRIGDVFIYNIGVDQVNALGGTSFETFDDILADSNINDIRAHAILYSLREFVKSTIRGRTVFVQELVTKTALQDAIDTALTDIEEQT